MGIKSILKKSSIMRKMSKKYNLLKLKNKENLKFSDVEKIIDDKYSKAFGKSVDWENPKTYTEKINFSKLYNFTKEKTILSDKYLVRDWVKEKIGEKYLVPLINAYNSFEEIDFNDLPNQFVIKCNHDSGSVTLVHNKNLVNKKELKEKYDYLLKRNFAYCGFEMHYANINPKIMIEKYMGESIKDYKFLCYNGKPYFCWVDFDRYTNHKRNIYNMNWELQKFNQKDYGNYDKKVEKPSNFDEMSKIAEKLSKGFDHVRVDLYDIDGKVYFGEMTFTNGNGFEPITPKEWDKKLGDLWNLDVSSRNKNRDKRLKDIKE